MEEDDNFFDDDDALDFILYEEMKNESAGNQDNQNKPGNAGYLGVMALFILPITGIAYTLLTIV